MLFHPTLRYFVLCPLLINILVFSVIAYWTSQKFSSWMSLLLSWMPDWLNFLEYFLWPLFLLAIAGVVFFTFTIIGNLIAAPFNAILAEKVQRMESAQLPTMAMKDWVFLVPKSIGRELRKWQYYLPRAIGLLILSCVPVVNVLSPFLWFYFNGWIIAVQYCDYAADNKMVSFTDMIKALKKNNPSVWLFGATVSLAMLIPLINLLVIPAAVVGSTLLWERRVESH